MIYQTAPFSMTSSDFYLNPNFKVTILFNVK